MVPSKVMLNAQVDTHHSTHSLTFCQLVLKKKSSSSIIQLLLYESLPNGCFFLHCLLALSQKYFPPQQLFYSRVSISTKATLQYFVTLYIQNKEIYHHVILLLTQIKRNKRNAFVHAPRLQTVCTVVQKACKKKKWWL